jgi:recombinational DNA repair ATPase RecF
MHISELRIRNVKRITAFSIGVDADPIILTGNNGQGKSSVLDSIYLALANKGLEDPVRHGAGKASVRLKLHGDEVYVVERNITKRSNTLTITKADGSPVTSPQAFLNSLVGTLAFDPLEFVRLKGKAQVEAIRELTGLDTSAIDKNYDATFATRTEVNRTVDTLAKQLKDMPVVDVPPENTEPEVSVVDLVAKRDEMQKRIQVAIDLAGKAQLAIRAAQAKHTAVGELREQLANAEREALLARQMADKLSADADDAKAEAPSAEEAKDLNEQISQVDATNGQIRARAQVRTDALKAQEARFKKAQEHKEALDRAEALTARLQQFTEHKEKLVREAKMPEDGMTFDEGGVFINGVRFDQMSTGEQVRVSTRIAMRANPKLKLILVREGALLNKANLKVICDAAKDGGYQLFLEKFQEEPSDSGIHIEDGAITHIDGTKVEPEQPPPAAAPEQLNLA